jgi:hypothetical protein
MKGRPSTRRSHSPTEPCAAQRGLVIGFGEAPVLLEETDGAPSQIVLDAFEEPAQAAVPIELLLPDRFTCWGWASSCIFASP